MQGEVKRLKLKKCLKISASDNQSNNKNFEKSLKKVPQKFGG